MPAAAGTAGPAADHIPTPVAVKVTITRPRWERRYARAAFVSDLCALAASAWLHRLWGAPSPFGHARLVFAAAVAVLTLAALAVTRAWDVNVLGQGAEEYNRLARAFVGVAVIVGLAGLALKAVPLRPYAFGVVPAAFVFAAASRMALRKRVHHLRGQGRCMLNVLAVGSEEGVARCIARARRVPYTGWNVTGACVPAGRARSVAGTVAGVPVLGEPDDVTDVVCRFGYHVVCLAPSGWSSRRLRGLAWDLEGTGTDIVVDPGLMDFVGRRLQVDDIDGFPMLRLTEPAFRGVPRLIKAVTDYLGAALLVVLLSPLMVAVAVAVKVGGGPVFYRQRRVGRSGAEFSMLKFRTMCVGADRMVADLADKDMGAGPLFKVHDDPRVTRVGGILRRYSLDELPQLFNVLSGSMSLVGPRPVLPQQAESFDREARRRLRVRPGMTGLWQVSGRSDLAWEESVRLDVRYVENWSLSLDALIVWKTVGAVLRGAGAY